MLGFLQGNLYIVTILYLIKKESSIYDCFTYLFSYILLVGLLIFY